jgi:hypothetical protein
MNTHFEPRCLMVPLGTRPCPSCDGYPHACAGKPGHTDAHRCECGYEWEERKIASLAVRRHGFTTRRWVARAAVLLICAAGFAGWYSSRADLDRAQRSTTLMHRALFYFGYDCTYQSASDALECMPVPTSSPSTSTPTQEEQ